MRIASCLGTWCHDSHWSRCRSSTVRAFIGRLRAVAQVTDHVRESEALVTERVAAAARANGRVWNRIATVFGVSRQGFASKIV